LTIFASAVKNKVASGLHPNASEVIREALQNSLIREQDSWWQGKEAAIGFAQLESRQTVEIRSGQDFKSLVRGKG
jgi:Arc/MetJ-type ribon-helix-helix transcriptional regulator